MIRTLTIDLDAQAPGRARAALDTMPELDESLRGDAKLLVSELITNSVKYGAGPVQLIVDAQPGRMRCEVADCGSGFTPVARTQPTTDVGGWGLYLVEALADAWGVQDGSTHVWFELSAGDG